MIHAQMTIVINRPIEEVFAYVADQTNAPNWQAGLVEVTRLTDGPPGMGTRHTLVRNFMGRRMGASNEYIAYEPSSRIAFRSTSGPMRFEASYLFEPCAVGTRLTSRIEMRPAGLSRLMQPLIATSLRREMKTAVAVLKDLLETRAAAVSPQPALP